MGDPKITAELLLQMTACLRAVLRAIKFGVMGERPVASMVQFGVEIEGKAYVFELTVEATPVREQSEPRGPEAQAEDSAPRAEAFGAGSAQP